MDHRKYEKVRTDTLDAIDLYVKQGIPTGSFLAAVLCNDLMEAMGRADMGNRSSLFEICTYIYNETPSSCHGSPQRVREWLEYKSKERHAKEVV